MTGNRIRQLREAKGFSQDVLAKKLGVNGSTVHRWEVGHTQWLQVSMLPRMAKELDTSVSHMMAWNDEDAAA